MTDRERSDALLDYRLDRDAKRRRAGEAARQIPAAVRREVLGSNDGNCVYCGHEATCVDHILPVSRGGTRRRRNLAPACKPCNEHKLNFTVEEWVEYRREAGLPWPPSPPLDEIHRRVQAVYISRPEFRVLVERLYGDAAPTPAAAVRPLRLALELAPELRELVGFCDDCR